MNYIDVARKTIQITKEKKYLKNGKEIVLPDLDYEAVNVITPEHGQELLEKHERHSDKSCHITMSTEDSFQAAGRYENALVMNFANAHVPGGGFLAGATAQEEALCRCSTLYNSISGKKAASMYHFNNTHLSKVESDYMLLSDVCVFRDQRCELLDQPFRAGVITVPAPNRIGAAILATEKEVTKTLNRRIRIMLMVAKEYGYRYLILGAWGCGAFHNSPKTVAICFKQALMEDGYGQYFDEVCFAIYGTENGKNYKAFQKVLEEA